jgi:hypothetical protein
MADPNQVENEFRMYLEIEPNLNREDRLVYLKSIANRHFGLDNLDHVITYGNFADLIGEAKKEYPKTSFPVTISRKEISSTEINYMLVLEAFASYLNRMKLLKKLVKFERTR